MIRALRSCLRSICTVGIALAILAGNRAALAKEPAVADQTAEATEDLIIPGNFDWADTGVDVKAGRPLSIAAHGTVSVDRPRRTGLFRQPPLTVSPKGTFLFSDEIAEKPFPMPAAGLGPAPCYCLIGRIGAGPPFFVGERKSWLAEASGRLYLGINDFNAGDNSGEFVVRISHPRKVQPIAFEETVTRDTAPGSPAQGCRAIVFYIDGLRPDVVREMAAMGHIPNINELFVQGGVWQVNAFTAFPSDTITSNGTMWTGCFSDRHGLKGQVHFSRRTLASESYLEPLGPNRSARLLAPQGIDKALQEAEVGSIAMFRGEEAGNRLRQSQSSGVPPLYEYLRQTGSDWATGALPMMTEIPPLLWTRSLTRHTPYFEANQSWKHIDDANTEYARYHLLGRHSPVTIIWLPETDSVSHKQRRGQFGMTRRTIATADQMVGDIVEELKARGEFDKTYFVLVSDHGHHGGRTTHLAHFDLANELFYNTREVSPDGSWVGGGLGMSVREHRFWNRHPEDGSRDFVFLDADASGAARVFLPRRHFHSGDWMGAPRPAEMFAYQISPKLPPVDLVASLTTTRAVHSDGSVQHPVDLVLLKLSDDAILISTVDRGQAVVNRKRNAEGNWVYKYTVVQNAHAMEDGSVAYDEVVAPVKDPLLLLSEVSPRLIEYYHDETEWLRITALTQYPDGVVALTRHMLWQENLRERERADAPDLVVTARSGWYFGHKGTPGTAHGHPFPDAMRASFFVAGPNIRRGARNDEPCRLADLTPTLVQMVGISTDAGDFDGHALQTIYESPQQISQTAAQPVYWQDVDLKAWKPINYAPLANYEHLPTSVNQPESPFDLNNITYSVLSIAEYNLLGIFDDITFPLSGGRDGRHSITRAVERVDTQARRSKSPRIAEAAEALDASQVTVGDYTLRSLGNMKRIDGTVDWVQNRGTEIGRKVAEPIGRESLPGAPILNQIVDGTQAGFWELYRFTQRIIVGALDETLLNGIENTTDRAINRFQEQPAEIVVPLPD